MEIDARAVMDNLGNLLMQSYPPAPSLLKQTAMRVQSVKRSSLQLHSQGLHLLKVVKKTLG